MSCLFEGLKHRACVAQLPASQGSFATRSGMPAMPREKSND